jgi:hypothetical protein
MASVIAFVAHSFTDEDAPHVNKVLEFLTRISKLNSSFSWSHAREAEPSDLKDKVLRTAENANLLIAICSKKERVFRSESAQPAWFSKNKLLILESDCQWATSDWITQEIGMGIGRDWKVILLVEDGVRTPGGMQGNLEYISFNRAHPEKSFQTLMEMISSLTGDEKPESLDHAAVGEPQQAADPVSSSNESEKSSVPVAPSIEMTLDQFESGVLNAYIQDDVRLISDYDKTFRSSAVGASEETRARWDARRQWLQQVLKGNGDLAKVRSLVEIFPHNSDISHYNALLLSDLGETNAAGEEFARSASLCTVSIDKIRRFTEAAKLFAKTGDMPAAMRFMGDAKKEFAAKPSDLG